MWTWTYPADGHETHEAHTFVVGQAPPGSCLTLQGEPILMSALGFFSQRVALAPGENELTMALVLDTEVSQVQTRRVTQVPRLTLDRDSVSAADLIPFAFPAKPMRVVPGTSLCLRCLAPSGAQVSARIVSPAASTTVPLRPQEASWESRTNVFGQLHQIQSPPPAGPWYTALWHIPGDLPLETVLNVTYTIETPQDVWTVRASGQIELASPMPVRVKTPQAIVRTAPEIGARKTPLLSGSVGMADQVDGDWVRLCGSEPPYGWIHRADLDFSAGGLPPQWPVPLHMIHLETPPAGLSMALTLPCPLPVAIQAEPDRMVVSLWGAVMQCDAIRFPPTWADHGGGTLTWTQPHPDIVQLTMRLDRPLLGAASDYQNGCWTLRCRTVPGQPMVVVLDPGHGGAESGSTAPNGTPEKDLNLAMALKLQDALAVRPEYTVHLTRTTDTAVDLEARVAFARQVSADLLLSLHHNALPDGRDPQVERGVSCYDYHAFARPLTQILQAALVAGTDFPDYGILYDSLHLCRVLEMPAVLVELGFLTHPEDAALCLDPTHQARVIQALVAGIDRWQEAIVQPPGNRH